MRSKLSAQINTAITFLLVLVAFLIPLIVTNATTKFYETPKLIFLLVVTCILLILKSFSWIIEGKVSFTRTPIDIPLLLFLGIMIISSANPYNPIRHISFFGNLPRVHGSTVSWIIYILFYFIAASHLREKGQVRLVFYALLASTTLAGISALLSYFGIYILGVDFTKFANFTPTGSSFSTAGLMVLLLPALLAAPVLGKKLLSAPLALALSCFFAVMIALIGDTSTYIAAVLGALLLLFIKYGELRGKILQVLGPVILGVAVLFLSFAPIGGNANPLHKAAQDFPREILLPFSTSWKISASAFRDSAFLGSGPSTYLFDFTAYKPIEYNATPLWNVRFETAFNEFLQIFGTTGLLGILAFLFLSLVIIGMAWRDLTSGNEDPLSLGLSIAAISSIVLLAWHPSTLVVTVGIFLVLAMLMAVHKNRSERVEELAIGIKASKLTDSNLIVGDILPAILFIPVLIIVVIVLFNAVQLVRADYHHRMALVDASTRGLDTYNELVKAEQLNPQADLYRTDLAQTNFALANAIATSKGPSRSSPSGSLTDQDKQNIQTLLSQSINEGRVAVTLNPQSAQNWEILASIYRQISGVAQNALQFSLDAYGRAIERDPLNPLLRLSVGGVYYSSKNYDMAIRFFSDAINLKPDFANGYYNLAVALRDKGDLQGAIASAQQTVILVDPKSQDYQTANKLLNDLKSQQAASASAQSTPPSGSVPPAAQENGALQNKNLPPVEVQGLNTPPSQIATPSAVKKTGQ